MVWLIENGYLQVWEVVVIAICLIYLITWFPRIISGFNRIIKCFDTLFKKLDKLQETNNHAVSADIVTGLLLSQKKEEKKPVKSEKAKKPERKEKKDV